MRAPLVFKLKFTWNLLFCCDPGIRTLGKAGKPSNRPAICHLRPLLRMYSATLLEPPGLHFSRKVRGSNPKEGGFGGFQDRCLTHFQGHYPVSRRTGSPCRSVNPTPSRNSDSLRVPRARCLSTHAQRESSPVSGRARARGLPLLAETNLPELCPAPGLHARKVLL